MPRKKIDKLTAFVKDYGAKGLAYVALQKMEQLNLHLLNL